MKLPPYRQVNKKAITSDSARESDRVKRVGEGSKTSDSVRKSGEVMNYETAKKRAEERKQQHAIERAAGKAFASIRDSEMFPDRLDVKTMIDNSVPQCLREIGQSMPSDGATLTYQNGKAVWRNNTVNTKDRMYKPFEPYIGDDGKVHIKTGWANLSRANPIGALTASSGQYTTVAVGTDVNISTGHHTITASPFDIPESGFYGIFLKLKISFLWTETDTVTNTPTLSDSELVSYGGAGLFQSHEDVGYFDGSASDGVSDADPYWIWFLLASYGYDRTLAHWRNNNVVYHVNPIGEGATVDIDGYLYKWVDGLLYKRVLNV